MNTIYNHISIATGFVLEICTYTGVLGIHIQMIPFGLDERISYAKLSTCELSCGQSGLNCMVNAQVMMANCVFTIACA